MKRLSLRRIVPRLVKGIILVALASWLGLKLVPLPAALERPRAESLILTDRLGVTLRETRTGDVFAKPAGLGDMPPHLIRALLAAEDKRFFSHRGVDVLATARAIRDGWKHGRIVSGASTISQQLVKVAQPRPRTFRTKVIEAVTALRLEQLWSKERILEEYLNRVDFGHLNTGIVAAADYYFGKPLSDLSVAEAAFLAGLPKNPSLLNPHRSLAATQKRQRTVLERMHHNGWLAAEPFARAMAETPALRPPTRQFRAPHFVDLALRQVEGGGVFQTTLDLQLNSYIERQVHDQLALLRSLNATNAAVVVIDNATGSVLALVGSEDYFSPGAGQFNGATARRSPGSTIKPFTYLLALEQGATPASVYADVPTEFSTAAGNYRVDNYQRRCSGPVSLRSALACSLNIPAVHALNSIGGPSVLQRRLTGLGLTTFLRAPSAYGLGLTLGNAEAKLIELTNAYACLARLGEFRPWQIFADEAAASAASRRVADPRAAWLIADVLSDNAARTPAFGAGSPLRFDFPVACKTGTSTDYRDNWAMGFTPEFTVGVWVGNFDGSPMRGVSGVSGAAPLMHSAMVYLHQRFGTSWYPTPPNVEEHEIEPLTGKRVTDPRVTNRREKFLAENLPPIASPTDYTEAGAIKLDPVYAPWLASAENTLGDRATITHSEAPLRIAAPVPGTIFVIDPDLPASRRVKLVASGARAVRWESSSLDCRDGEALASEGDHRLIAVDPVSGERAETWIRVKSL